MRKRHEKTIMAVSILILIILGIASVCMGRFSISFSELFTMISGKIRGITFDTNAETILWQVRIPRILVAVMIGSCLSLSGAAYQGVFRNPMVSPDILGASAGAGFGAALGFLFGLPTLTVQLMAFTTGMAAVFLTWALHRLMGTQGTADKMMLILSGIVTGALFQALISIIKYVADPYDTMPSIAFWLMGGLTYVTDSDVKFLLIPALLGGIPLLLVRWRLNLLAFDTEEAEAMGMNIRKYRAVVMLCSTMMTAACVAVGGMIGWVGLIVPHFARMAVGPDYKKMLPCVAVFGGIFMLVVDDLARCLFAQELPIGILTALVGAPVFAVLLMKGRRGFS